MTSRSRTFQLHHPWLTLLSIVMLAALGLGLMALPVWGWIALRFSPVQRHYLPIYLQSSVGVLTGDGPEYVEWIKKKGSGRDWVIVQPDDLVPTGQDYPPFQLSPAALAHGWTDLGFNTDGVFTQRDIRDTLQTEIFDGHSLLFFVLQPFELFLVGFLCWKVFDHWREQQARERGAVWDVNYRPTPWGDDLALFLNQLARETREGAVGTLKWIVARQQSLRRPAAVEVESATVSPSGIVQAAPPVPIQPKPKAVTPVVSKVVEVAPVLSPKPAAPATKPSRTATPKPQRAKAQPEPQPTPGSPFGKPIAEGEPERKWDISQWID